MSKLRSATTKRKNAAKWTDAEIAKVRAGREAGLTTRTIAEGLPGRSRGAVKALCETMHIRLVRKIVVQPSHRGRRASTPVETSAPSFNYDAIAYTAAKQGSDALLRAYARYYERHVAKRAA